MRPVLTLDKLKTYEAFGGDADGYARCGPAGQRAAISGDDWALIDQILTGLDSAASGLASPGFVEALEMTLRAATPDEDTRAALRELAGRLRKPTAGGAS